MNKLLIAIICASMVMIGGVAFAGDVTVGDDSAGSSADSQSAAGAMATIDSHDKNTTINRHFVSPGVVPMPGTNGFFTNPTPDSSFRSIRDIITAMVGPDKYCIVLSKGALKNMAKGGDVDTHLQILRGDDQIPRVYSAAFEGTEYLYIAVEEPVFQNGKLIGTKRVDGLTSTGLIDGEADNADTNSIQVIGKVGLKALKDGNNYMVITAEGAHRMVEASGWGIGLYTVGGDISDSGERSGVGGGGTGFAKNRTGTEDKPWIQGYVGVRDMPYPPIQ
jgi:hypothetical protein